MTHAQWSSNITFLFWYTFQRRAISLLDYRPIWNSCPIALMCLMSHFMNATLRSWSQYIFCVLCGICCNSYLIYALVSSVPQVRPLCTHGSSSRSHTWAASWTQGPASWPRASERLSWTWRRCTNSPTWRKMSQDSIPNPASLPLAWTLCLARLLCDDLVPTILTTRKRSSEKMEGPLEWG